MKYIKSFLAAVAFGLCLGSCGSQSTEPKEAEASMPPAREASPLTAIDDYLCSEIGPSYAPGDVCIPDSWAIFTDDSDTTDILVWCDCWVFNYNIDGDTLKTVSGGNHPGLFHVCKTGNEYTVTAFEQVEDGAGNEASARRIFGQHYAAFLQWHSDTVQREITRSFSIASYLEKHSDVRASWYQDSGWPAKDIPVESYL